MLVVLVMRMLAETAAAIPSSGSSSTYAEDGIGRWAGFTVGRVLGLVVLMATDDAARAQLAATAGLVAVVAGIHLVQSRAVRRARPPVRSPGRP
ncbi:hypothetical protein [Cellulomonas aerilata]|uniref:Amino acid permease/ SLC12A domain-containing protein n=1 Tax=Cellulomonas aerilata TaxID=515326 RepID=A0A512D7C6_9CELL|nr:hypothetical protein CAE01nite_00940 [Cellulomonas aerilata]